MTGSVGAVSAPLVPVTEHASGAQARTRANLTVIGIALGSATFLGCLVVLSWLRKPGGSTR